MHIKRQKWHPKVILAMRPCQRTSTVDANTQTHTTNAHFCTLHTSSIKEHADMECESAQILAENLEQTVEFKPSSNVFSSTWNNIRAQDIRTTDLASTHVKTHTYTTRTHMQNGLLHITKLSYCEKTDKHKLSFPQIRGLKKLTNDSDCVYK